MGDVVSQRVSFSLRENIFSVGYVLVILAGSVYFTHRYVAGLQSASVEWFSRVFIPLLTLFVHLLLLRVLSVKAYSVIMFLDLIVKLGLVTYHDYFGDNLDIHVIWANFSEGVAASNHVLQVIPKNFLLVGLGIVTLECALAAKLNERFRNRALMVLAVIVVPMFALTAYKVPLRQAAVATDYALCIKLHGYYTAMLADLAYTGVPPLESDLLTTMQEQQQRHPVVKLDIQLPLPHPYRNLLAIQVESLDFNVLDFRSQGREVTPFLNWLSNESVLMKLDSFHYGASGSSGADFQFLTGMLPLQTYPTYKIRSLDYTSALPSLYARAGISTFAFHGNVASMWARGWAYQQMGVTHFYDAKEFPASDTRWGVSDQAFFQHSTEVIEAGREPRVLYFLITLSSHGPFDFVKHTVFPASDMVGRYFNAINYTDRALQQFLLRLKGEYLVILYGDHSANVSNEVYTSRVGEKEFVPAMIFLLENGRVSKPQVSGDTSNLLTGALDLRSLHFFAKDAFP